MSFTITIKPTSITVYPGRESIDYLGPLLDLLTYEDEYVEETKTLGYIYDEDADLLYLHKGVDINYLKKLLIDVTFKTQKPDIVKEMTFDYEEIIPPRNNEQVDVINFITGTQHHSDNVTANQIFLVKTMGFGKTFCAGAAACQYHKKTLIITHRDSLRKQWINSLYNMQGLSNKEVHEIASSDEIVAISQNKHNYDYDIYMMTHATFRAGLKRLHSFEEASNITKNLGIGLKIIDEAHLEFRDTLLMDFVFNVQRNLYMTATDGRSSKEENSIFKHVFSRAVYYKPSTLLTTNMPKKWVEYTMVEVDTHVKPNIYRYRINGGRGMNPASYGKWVIKNDKKQTHFKVCEALLRNIFENDKNAKILIFMPLIDLCSECEYFLNKALNYDESFEYSLDLGTINSSNTKSENERNKKCDVIITTIASCGTGTDLPGITSIINCSPFVSKITAKQVFGRLRYCGKTCQFYDVYDRSVQMDVYWIKSRSKVIKSLALNTKNIKWTNDA